MSHASETEAEVASHQSRPAKGWLQGALAGLVAGVLDVILIVVAEPNPTVWLLLQSLIAWTLAGWVVVATESGFRPLVHGMFVTVLLNLPWYIQFAFATGQWDHFPPLLVMSLLFGAAFGWTKKRAQQRLNGP